MFTIRAGRRRYAVQADGWCEGLGAWVVRDQETGRLMTIPGRDDT